MTVSGTESSRSVRRRMSVDERREEIVATAARLFDQRGYALTGMEDIAMEVGIAKPTLYHYFQSKDEILAAVHEEISEFLRRRLEARAPAGLGPAQTLFEMIVDLLELAQAHPGHQRVWTEHYRELPDAAYQAREARSRLYRERMQQCIKDGIEEGTFRSVDPYITSMMILGAGAWAYQWLGDVADVRARDIAFAFWGTLLNGIAVDKAATAASVRRD